MSSAEGTPPKPGPQTMTEAFEHLMDSLTETSRVFWAVGALSNLYYGKEDSAVEQLEKLPAAMLYDVSAAAARLAILADQLGAAKAADPPA